MSAVDDGAGGTGPPRAGGGRAGIRNTRLLRAVRDDDVARGDARALAARDPELEAQSGRARTLPSTSATASEAPRPSPSSPPPGAAVLAQHATARAYPLRSHPVRGSVAERAWFGCVRGQRKHPLLAVYYGDVEDKAELSLTMPRVRGVWAAWVEDWSVLLPTSDPPCERR